MLTVSPSFAARALPMSAFCRLTGARRQPLQLQKADLHGAETSGKLRLLTVVAVEVTLLLWPTEAEARRRLAAQGSARLLLVEPGFVPPVIDDPIEDWIRLPAAERDVHARVDTLTLRSGHHSPLQPVLDDDDVVRVDSSWVALPPVEARLTRALLDRFGRVASRSSLSAAGWPAGSSGRSALDVHVLRLRRRLSTVGLVIRTVRSRGYLLEAAPGSLRRDA
jgi:hypothetical protein